MRQLFQILFLLAIATQWGLANDAATSRWRYYTSFFNTRVVEKAADKVYAIAEGGLNSGTPEADTKPRGTLFSYTREDNSVKEYNRLNGLSDVQATYVKYNAKTKSLLVVYNNWNIDILDNNLTTNLPYLYNNTSFPNKEVNSVMLHNEYAYLSTNFGIVVINMEKKEVKDTYNLSTVTTSCAIEGGNIYASTAEGVLTASTKSNLLDRNNWRDYPLNTSLFSSKEVTNLFYFKGKMCFFVKRKGIYYANGATITPIISNTGLIHIKLMEGKLAAISQSQVRIFSEVNAFDLLNEPNIKDISPAEKSDSYWIAAGSAGLKHITKGASGGFTATADPIVTNSPKFDSAYRIVCNNDNVYVVPGGKSSNGDRFSYSGQAMTYVNGRWETLVPPRSMRDFTSIALHPKDPTQLFAASFGDGMVWFKDKETATIFDTTNSTIESALSAPNSTDYKYIDGLAVDKQGNVWMNNSEANKPIKVMDTEGRWHSVSCPPLTNQYTLNNLLITSTDKKWFNIPRVNPKVVVLDTNGTIDDTDDSYNEYSSFVDQDGNSFSPGSYNCMAEDKGKQLWIGTSKGAIFISNPDRAVASTVRCTRIKLVNEEGDAYYFLDNVKVNCITIDGGNRKWMGTDGDGVYVLSADNQEVVHYFNTANSPILSNTVYSIGIHDASGEVLIGTDKGIASYRGEATKGRESYSDVYAFPNPVRPDFNEKVTITGLMDNSNVKITDISGNLLFQTKSIGGQATWDCKNRSGNRVGTGVYLVLLSTEGGGESVVTKIAVVK